MDDGRWPMEGQRDAVLSFINIVNQYRSSISLINIVNQYR